MTPLSTILQSLIDEVFTVGCDDLYIMETYMICTAFKFIWFIFNNFLYFELTVENIWIFWNVYIYFDVLKHLFGRHFERIRFHSVFALWKKHALFYWSKCKGAFRSPANLIRVIPGLLLAIIPKFILVWCPTILPFYLTIKVHLCLLIVLVPSICCLIVP